MAPDYEQLAQRFAAVYTAALTDVLDDLGYKQQTLPAEITALESGMRVAGPAFAVEGRSNPAMEYEPSIRRILEMLGAIPAHHVAVYQANDRTCAQFGELSAVSLQSRGCAGVVVDGGCRDVDYIIREEFPVFAAYTTPQDAVPRWEVLGWGHEVVIGGVRIETGDYVVGDEDGVAVVPKAVTEQVLSRAEGVVGTENEVRDAVRAGMAPLEAYERFGKF